MTSGEYSTDFERLWSVYPRKVSKHDSFKAFQKLNPDAELLEQIMLHVKQRTSTDPQWRDKTKVPYLSTFLSQRRFMDDLGEVGPVYEQTVPASQSSNPALRYEREHPPEPAYEPRPGERTALRIAIAKFVEETQGWLDEIEPAERPEAPNQMLCLHEWGDALWVGGQWCIKCGCYADQLWIRTKKEPPEDRWPTIAEQMPPTTM